MNNFKIGDKIKLKKLLEKEFKEIYRKKYNLGSLKYNDYLNEYKNYFNKIYEITIVTSNGVYCNKNNLYCYKEEIEKINHLKTKYKIVKELLKNE